MTVRFYSVHFCSVQVRCVRFGLVQFVSFQVISIYLIHSLNVSDAFQNQTVGKTRRKASH